MWCLLVETKTLVGIIVLAIVVGAAAGGAGYFYGVSQVPTPTPTPKVEIVEFMQDWLPNGRATGLFVAMDKGFYEEEGLSIRILRGYGGVKTLSNVDLKKVTFGYCDISSVILGISKGAKVKGIGSLTKKTQVGWFSYVGSGIKTVKDWPKASLISSNPGSPSFMIFPLLLKVNGIDPETVNHRGIEASIALEAFLTGKIDVVDGWRGSNFGVAVIKARKEVGKELNWIGLYDNGIKIPGNSFIAHLDTIENRPDLVRRFMHATARGYEYAAAHEDEAIAIVLKYHPELEEELVRLQWEQTLEDMILPPKAEKGGFGWYDPAEVEEARDVILEGFEVEVEVPVEDIYTNEFLPGA